MLNTIARLLVAIAGAVLLAGLCLFALRVRPMLQHRGYLVAQQSVGSNPNLDPCQLKDLSKRSNAYGMVAVIRDVNCPGDFAQGSGYFAVFVHKNGESNAENNLAFEFEPGYRGANMTPAPTVRWNSPYSLKITVVGPIAELDDIRSEISGINIAYSLGDVQRETPDAKRAEPK